GRLAGTRAIPPVGRGKMLDNLRRSVQAPASFLALGTGWMLPMRSALLATALIVLCVAIPAVLSSFNSVLSRREGLSLRHRLTTFAQDLYLAGAQVVAFFIFLADNAWRMTDAIIRTLWRL